MVIACFKVIAMQLLNGHEPSAIKKAIQLLKDGDIVAFPTETVYGLGADVFNPYAVLVKVRVRVWLTLRQKVSHNSAYESPFPMRDRSQARGSVSTAGGCLPGIGLTP